MKRLLTFFLTCACLHGCASVHAQASLSAVAGDPPARKLTWAAKVQAYQPLSWLAEPLNGNRDFRFTPRFWTGEVELGFSERSAVQVSVGVRHLNSPLNTLRPNPAFYIRESGYRAAVSYRHRFGKPHAKSLTGLYWAPFVGYLYGKGAFKPGAIEFQNEFTTHYFSTGATIGWQFSLGKHLLIDVGAGPEIAYQHTWVANELTSTSSTMTPLEYLALPILRDKQNDRAGLGLTGKLAFALGWKF